MASTDEREVLSCGGREVAISNPRKVLFPEAGVHQARSRALLPRRRPTARCGRPAAGPTCSSAIRTASAASSSTRSARPIRGPSGSRWCRCTFRPAGPRKKSSRATPPRWSGWPTWRASSCIRTRCAPTISIIPDELRVDLDPVPGVEWPQIQRGRAGRARGARRSRPRSAGRRPPARAASTSTSASNRRWTFDQVRRAALALAREVERRAPATGDEQMVEGGTPRRVPRLQPEREGSHGGRRLLGAAEAGRARVGAADVGRGRRLRSARLHAADDAGAVRGGRRSRTPPSTIGRARSTRCSSCPSAHEREGLGDAPWPPHYRKQAGEPSRVAPSRARKPPTTPESSAKPTGRRTSTKPLLEIGRARSKDDALAGLERWKARHPDAAAHLEPADVLVDAMRGRFQTWTRIRVNLQHVPEALRPAQEALDPNEDPLNEDWQKAMAAADRRRRPSRARTES